MLLALCLSALGCGPSQPSATADHPASRAVPADPTVAANPAPQPTLPPPPTDDAEQTRESTLVLATIADNPQEGKDKDAEAAKLLPFLAQKLRPYGITHAKLVYCHNPAEMAAWVKEGIVDIVDESPLGSYLVHRLSGNADEVILNRWKNYNEKFGGVLFTRADSPIKKLDDLKGKLIAFRGDTSTTQYFLQKVQLVKQGYKLVEVPSPAAAKIGPGEIGYYFAWSSRDKVTEDVFDGIAAAGGNSDEFIEKLLGHHGTEQGGKSRHPRPGVPEIKKEDLRVIARSPLVTRRVVTVRKSLDPKLKTAIKDLLLGLEASEEGRAILKSFGPAKKFTVVDEATAYAGIADQGELVEAEVAKFTKLANQ